MMEITFFRMDEIKALEVAFGPALTLMYGRETLSEIMNSFNVFAPSHDVYKEVLKVQVPTEYMTSDKLQAIFETYCERMGDRLNNGDAIVVEDLTPPLPEPLLYIVREEGVDIVQLPNVKHLLD